MPGSIRFKMQNISLLVASKLAQRYYGTDFSIRRSFNMSIFFQIGAHFSLRFLCQILVGAVEKTLFHHVRVSNMQIVLTKLS